MFFRLFEDILVQMFDSVRQGQNKTPAFCDTLEGVAFWPCLTQSLNIEYLLFGHMEPKCIFFGIPEKTNALVQSVGTEMDWFNRWPLFYTRHLTRNGHIPTLKRHSQPCCCLESGFGVVYMTAIQVIFNSEGQKFIQCKPK